MYGEELVMLSRELVAASAEPLILSLLSGGESYGYAIKKEGRRVLAEQREQWLSVHSVLAGLWKERYV